MTEATTPTRRQLDPDRLASLEEERDFLLRSLDDLEAEFQAGDIDEADYTQLHSDYTARAADTIRSIENRRTAIAAAAPSRSVGRIVSWVVGLTVFAVGAGWLLAQAVGERGVNDQITGSIELSPREQFLECQFLDQQGRADEANQCYGDILEIDPGNVEALSYRGWLLVRISTEAARLGRTDESEELLLLGKGALLDATQIDPSFADARAFRTIVFNGEGDTEAACAELAIFNTLNPPEFMRGLVEQNMAEVNCT